MALTPFTRQHPGRGRAAACALAAAVLVPVVGSGPAHAAWIGAPVPASDLCVQAIATAEPARGMPPNLLAAIGRVESGRTDPRDGLVKAWPWSINAEGKGSLFPTKAEAIAAVLALQARGVASIDVGCMQVNLMHHPAAFATLDHAFDPAVNVAYAIRFLTSLHAETNDWSVAAAYYHSRTPDLAQSYQRKVMAQMPGAALAAGPWTRRSAVSNAWAATVQPAARPGVPPPGAAPAMMAGWTVLTPPRPARGGGPRPILVASRP